MNQNRVIKIRNNTLEAKKVVYVMHNAYRIRNNHALAHALNYHKDTTIIVVFPFDTNERTVDFFKTGTKNIKEVLYQVSRDVLFVSRNSITTDMIPHYAHVVMDMYYLKEERALFQTVRDLCLQKDASLDVVETNTVVPVTETSSKEEYSARTIRAKIHKLQANYLDEVFPINASLVAEEEALRKLRNFIENRLELYHLKNDPSQSVSSELSPYLKYGFISPLTIVKELQDIESENKESFLEELIIRRELAYNFVFYNADYDTFEGMSYSWAYNTMKNHLNDEREYIYTKEDYIHFRTHDEFFNTAMKEMIFKGNMHGYMRMYWCKKIIEWSSSYSEAYKIAIELNNLYFIDGNSPNGYAGVAWCFGKHDRAWKERPIFGKLRYMNAAGLERKFDIDTYVLKVEKEVRNNEK